MLLAGGSSFGDDQPAAKQAPKEKHTANKPVAPQGAKAATTSAAHEQAAKTHLPAGFGKVKLTPEQHQKATAVVEKYACQIKQLESQIHELKAKRNNELTALLNDTQKKSLAEAQTTSQKAKEEKKAAVGKTVVRTKRGFHVDPNELKALHDQAERNLAKAAKQGQPSSEQPAAQQKSNPPKHKKEQTKEQPKVQPSEQEKK